VADPIVVVGGGVGGMVAALRARRRGADVCLVEAREQLGGLASAVIADGTTFDGGPYILLDRERLGWALDRVDIDLGQVEMVNLEPAYTVTDADDGRVGVYTDLERTVDELNAADSARPGDRYRRYVERATVGLGRLAPLLTEPHDPVRFVTTDAWRATWWALGSLQRQLQRNRLDGLAANAVIIWTLIAGADPAKAPGPMGLVPALIHRDGAVRPAGGVHRLITTIEQAVVDAGVTVRRGVPVTSIDHRQGRVSGVTLADGERIEARTVISDIDGATALLDLVDLQPPRHLQLRLAGPLQSPGLTAYARLRGSPTAEIRFRIDGDPLRARAVIHPSETDGDGRAAGRLIAPLPHGEAAAIGGDGQRELLERYVGESWWRSDVDGVEVVETRTIGDWGETFRLRNDAMNLVMARRQMLLGRLPYRIKHLPGLFLTGSWTHPGQWISFCSVSGVLAADQALDHHLRSGPAPVGAK